MNGIVLGFAAYMILMGGIGVWSYMKTKGDNSIESFVVGKRDFGPVLTAFGVGTSLASGYAFIGLVGAAYVMGSMALFQPFFTTCMEAILWFKLSKKIRSKSIETGSLTPVELLSKLKGDPYNLIKVIGGLMISMFVMFYLAGQFVSGAKAATVLGIPFNTAVWVSALVVMAYVFLGGVLAVMWTDAIQGVMMVGTFILLLITVLVQTGGFFEAFDALSKVAPNNVMWTNGKVGIKLLLPILTWFGVGWCFWGQPQAIQKFLTIKDEKSLPAAAVMSIGFNTIRQYVPIMMGLCGRVLFDNLKDPELLTPTILATYYPNIIGGLALASIFAAIMSTTDSLILQSTSEFTRNVMQLSLLPNASEKTIGYSVKVITLVVAAGGIYIAMGSTSNQFTMTLFAFAGLSAAITGPLWLGILWNKCTSWGILAGVALGIPITMWWFYTMKASTGLGEGVVGNIGSFAVVYIVSLLTQKSLKNNSK